MPLAAKRRFEQIVLEPFVQQIGDAHRQDAQKFVHLFFAEAMKFPADFHKLGGIETAGIGLIGKRHAVKSSEKRGEIFGERTKRWVFVCVGLGMASDLRGGLGEVPRNQQRVTVEAWRKQQEDRARAARSRGFFRSRSATISLENEPAR